MLPDGVASSVDVPAWVVWVIVAGAVLTALRAMLRTKVVTWLTRQVGGTVAQMVREVVREETNAIRDELRTNGGATLRDAIDRVEHEIGVTKDTLEEHLAVSMDDRRDLRIKLELLERLAGRDE